MTKEQNPIILPPPELAQQWRAQAPRCRDGGITREDWLMARAAQWGAEQASHDIKSRLQEARDKQFEECCDYILKGYSDPAVTGGSRLLHRETLVKQLRLALRPKSSLKQQALALVNPPPGYQPFYSKKDIDILRRALELLPDD